MNDKIENFWGNLCNELHDSMGWTSQSEEEIQKQLNAIECESISEEEIESLVQSVSSGNITSAYRRIDYRWSQDHDTESIESEIFSLNRNKGLLDEEVDDKLNELRKKALEENTGHDDQEHEKRPRRMEDDEAAGEKSG